EYQRLLVERQQRRKRVADQAPEPSRRRHRREAGLGLTVDLFDANEIPNRGRTDLHLCGGTPTAPCGSGTLHKSQVLPVKTQVPTELRMEGQRHHAVLAEGDRVAIVLRQDFGRAGVLHNRGPDEDAAKWASVEPGHFEVGLETVHLAAVPVAANRDVEGVKEMLILPPVRNLV